MGWKNILGSIAAKFHWKSSIFSVQIAWASRFSHFGHPCFTCFHILDVHVLHVLGVQVFIFWTSMLSMFSASRFSHFGRPCFTYFRRPGFHILDVHVLHVFGVQVFTFWTSIIYNRRPKITVHVLLLPSNESSMLYIRCPSCGPYIASCDHV